jgi:hypothetical protein
MRSGFIVGELHSSLEAPQACANGGIDFGGNRDSNSRAGPLRPARLICEHTPTAYGPWLLRFALPDAASGIGAYHKRVQLGSLGQQPVLQSDRIPVSSGQLSWSLSGAPQSNLPFRLLLPEVA